MPLLKLDFPSRPVLNQITNTGGKDWKWDGSRWVPQTIVANNIVITGALSANGSNGSYGFVLSSNGSGVYWANNNLGNLSDVIVADTNANPPVDGSVLMYVSSEDKYFVMPIQVSNQILDGGGF